MKINDIFLWAKLACITSKLICQLVLDKHKFLQPCYSLNKIYYHISFLNKSNLCLPNPLKQ